MPRQIYEIGPFVADAEARALMRGGEVIPVTPKAFDVLLTLIRASGAPVTREEIMQTVWGDSLVEEANLTNAIWVLRKAFGQENGQNQYIVTIPRRGYRLVVPVGERSDTDPEIEIDEYRSERLVIEEDAPRPRVRFSRIAAAVAVALLGAAAAYFMRTSPSRQLRYEQITHFPGSVGSPALSRDGRMLAFLGCSADGSPTCPGQLFLKILPSGEPVALTRDALRRGMPAFSHDGSRIAFTMGRNWSVWTTPLPSGEASQLLPKAAGLSWIGAGRLIYSHRAIESDEEIRWAVKTSDENGSGAREIYRASSRYGIIHFPRLSPDGRWVLFGELDLNGWHPCRLVPFEGVPTVRQVGPPNSQCTSTAWSPDGRWMYFVAAMGGVSHIWRQRFPDGQPEQLTSGPMEEAGIAVDPDGRSLITAAGSAHSSVWIQDASGQRQVSQEGYAFRPSISPDGHKVYYLIRGAARRPTWLGELWSADLQSGQRERVLTDYLVSHYDLSRDGRTVVFDTIDAGGNPRIWIGSTERSFAPRPLSPTGAGNDQRPFFGASGQVYFLREEPGHPRYVYRMNADGSNRRKASPDPVLFFVSLAPNEKWVISWSPLPSKPRTRGMVALPIGGGEPVGLCECGAGPIFPVSPSVSWTRDGRHMLLVGRPDPQGESVGLPVLSESLLPRLPEQAPLTWTDLARLPGAKVISEQSISPGLDMGTFAFTRFSMHQNLYRIHLPD